MKFYEIGRSMVEMLGVLAIIGVLSVGAIAGYSKAMFKYKSNKQAEQLSTIISAVSRYQNDLRLNDGSTDTFQLIPLLKKLHEIPEDMFVKNNESELRDVFNSKYLVYHHVTGYIGILSYLQNDDSSLEVCRNIYSVAKEFHADVSDVRIIITQNDNTGSQPSTRYGDKNCHSGRKCLRDMTVTETDELCRVCDGSKYCILYIMFGIIS